MTSAGNDTPATCRDVEERFGATGRKGIIYRKHFPGCECERHSVSAHSPCLVADEEVLVRLLPPGSVKPDATTGIAAVDPRRIRGVEEMGLSVFRAAFITEGALWEIVERLARKNGVPASQFGFALVLCSKVRSFHLNGTGVYCVHDSATESEPSHADIHRGLDFPPGTPDQRGIFRGYLEHLARCFVLTDSLSDVFSRAGPDNWHPPEKPPWSIS